MHSIDQFLKIAEMPSGTIIYHINQGNVTAYIVVGTVPQLSNSIILLDRITHKSVIIRNKDLEIGHWRFTYDSNEFGQLMIQQIEEDAKMQITSVQQIYLKN